MSRLNLFGVRKEQCVGSEPRIVAPVYDNIPFQKYVKFWEDSLKMIGKEGWSTFSHLFFHPDGELCGVNDFFVKAPPPSSSLTQQWEWVAQATVISRKDWSSFKLLFFDLWNALWSPRRKAKQRTDPIEF